MQIKLFLEHAGKWLLKYAEGKKVFKQDNFIFDDTAKYTSCMCSLNKTYSSSKNIFKTNIKHSQEHHQSIKNI